MRLVVKGVGIALIIACSSLLGFLKSFSKRDYINRLKNIDSALVRAENLLKYGTFNRERILKNAFYRVEKLSLDSDSAHINDKAMSEELGTALNTFLNDFGSGDILAEQSRIRGIREILLNEIKLSEEEYSSSGRIWRTAGVCAGLAIGIMMI